MRLDKAASNGILKVAFGSRAHTYQDRLDREVLVSPQACDWFRITYSSHFAVTLFSEAQEAILDKKKQRHTKACFCH